MTVAEVLKAAGIADDVAAGLPADVVKALGGYVSEADTKLSTAATEAQKAEEARRQAELERTEINQYVEQYGTSITEMANAKAQNEALVTYLNSLKTQGFDIKIPGIDDKKGVEGKPAVPGSPAVGGNAIDENKILGKVGDVLSQFLDANNEHIRLYGTPIPDSSTSLGEEAARARKPIGQYIREKYKFTEKHEEKSKADFEKKVSDAVASKLAEEKRKEAEARGSNPNVRAGEPSRSSLMPRVKTDEFHKADGNQGGRERRERLLSNIRRDVEAIRNNAA